MPMASTSNQGRKATNISIDAQVVADAKALGLNISKACERGLVTEIAAVRGERWLAENVGALEAWNVWIEENGLPLEEYRQF